MSQNHLVELEELAMNLEPYGCVVTNSIVATYNKGVRKRIDVVVNIMNNSVYYEVTIGGGILNNVHTTYTMSQALEIYNKG